MLKYENGQLIPLTTQDNIERAYQALQVGFPDISRTQFNGSREYELAYMLAQYSTIDATLLTETLTTVLSQAALDAEELLSSNTLQFRFEPALKSEGYIVNARHGPGTMNIAVLPIKDDGSIFDPASNADGGALAGLLSTEYVPSGTVLEISTEARAAVGAVPVEITLSGIPIRYIVAPPIANQRELHITVEVESIDGASSTIYTPSIIETVTNNWESQNRLGKEIIPQQLITMCDTPWAKSLRVGYEVTDAGGTVTGNLNYLPSGDNGVVNSGYHPDYFENFTLNSIKVI